MAGALAVLGLLLLPDLGLGAEHVVRNPALIPQIRWCRGATPTAAAMALGYWDNYVPSSAAITYLGCGRLIDYWRDLSRYADGTGAARNAPNILPELVKAMKTTASGGTSMANVSWGIMEVANQTNRYWYVSDQYKGAAANDYCWPYIKSQIANNCPFVWSVGYGTARHSLCAFGYDDFKYVIVYNTWNSGRDYWYYRRYNNEINSSWQYVHTVVPMEWQGDNGLVIHALRSSAYVAGSRLTINWRQYGTLIKRASIYYSVSGGTGWKLIASGRSSKPNVWNYCYWRVPDKPTTRCRIRIYGYSSTSYIAGDGLKKNFTIQSR